LSMVLSLSAAWSKLEGMDPILRHWCVGCDTVRLWTLMAWTREGRWLCAVCRGVPVFFPDGSLRPTSLSPVA
jgi:hypothetical protein